MTDARAAVKSVNCVSKAVNVGRTTALKVVHVPRTTCGKCQCNHMVVFSTSWFTYAPIMLTHCYNVFTLRVCFNCVSFFLIFVLKCSSFDTSNLQAHHIVNMQKIAILRFESTGDSEPCGTNQSSSEYFVLDD